MQPMIAATKTLNRLFSKATDVPTGLAGTPGAENISQMVSCSLFAASSRRKMAKPLVIRQARPIFRMRPRFWRNLRVLGLKYRERKQRRAGFARLKTEPKFPHELSDRLDLPTEASRRLSSSSERRADYAHRQSPVHAEASRMLANPA